MDGIRQRLTTLAQRYKFVILVIAVGFLLMVLPTGEGNIEASQPEAQQVTKDMDTLLEQILSQIEGVGKVRVMLTISRGEETVYIFNEDESSSGGSGSQRQEAVVITGREREQAGLVGFVIGPVYQGAIVVCQGGDQAGIRLQIVEAVCDATGLTADKVTVLKMK